MSAVRLAFESVACLRSGRLLFEDRSFALEAGQAALLTGPNGVGKSSLLRMAAGLLPAAAGRIIHNGAIAFAGEAAALDPRQTLSDALAFWAKLDGRGAADVERGLAAMGIAGLAEVPVRMLSTGQRKRATLARIVAGGAQIWLLDEPSNGLDSASLARLATAMAVHREAGGIVLAATHQPLGLIDPLEIAL
ncbi:heme exporter protein A [Sphingomonas sp. YR710]|uniref:heme ABC exporter ATP-binding protein CcmA n=1 Tax=Sphingomonas sp. YR710 TaxID=1882773 RepID=UPI000885ADFF|nr:heme ABC exporter ATP-binding protein CcmA [Sphingomonas sp. YR710]SDC14895.1 heme exporter protein A [Sphingomonas sp. YR710]